MTNSLVQQLNISMRKVSYLYNQDITKYEFSKQHPMKTKRLKMVHSLIKNYDLTSHLTIYQSKEATSQQMTAFHHPHYIKYLETWVSPTAQPIVEQFASLEEQQRIKSRQDAKLGSIFKVNQSFDCPGFQGLFDFCKLAAGSSLDAADLILSGEADIAINWSGGFHHAKKTEASGFCYVNDIVLCILELLKVYPRVLYLDIDVHHGDGVEEAFFHTNRVLTVSFHQFEEDFFPGTGALDSVGEGQGKFFTVNIPLKKGMDDLSYTQLFKKIMDRLMGSFAPDVLVIQCGADSLSKDKLGHLNLSIRGHSELLTHMKSYGTPMVLLGGGGYTIQNVSRCWTYQTGLMVGQQIDDQMPKQDAYSAFYSKENNRIHFEVDKNQNQNSREYLEYLLQTVTENIREAQIRPSIAFHSVPKHYLPTEDNDWEMKQLNENQFADEACERFMKKAWFK